jgi:hypothetical protein
MAVRVATLVSLLVLAGCGSTAAITTVAEPATTAPAPEGTPIAFGFLTSDARFTAVILQGTSQIGDYGVVTSPGGNQSIQYMADASYELDLVKLHELADVRGGITPTLFRTKPRPVMPVLVWRLDPGTLWVVARHESEVDLLAAKMVVSQDQSGIPHVALQAPLTGGDLTDPSQREQHLLYGTSCVIINAGEFAADEIVDGLVTVATPFGVTVQCNGEPAKADATKERAETIAASITPDE